MRYIPDFMKRLSVFALSLFTDRQHTSALWPQFSHIVGLQQKVLEEALRPWYGFHRKGVTVVDLHNNPIRFFGVAYPGRPQRLFWEAYMLPLLEEALKTAVRQCVAAMETKTDNPQYQLEVQELLKALIRHILAEIARTDALLRGPQARRRNITALVSHYDNWMQERLQQEAKNPAENRVL
jgi:hypothetical protein